MGEFGPREHKRGASSIITETVVLHWNHHDLKLLFKAKGVGLIHDEFGKRDDMHEEVWHLNTLGPSSSLG